jgi:hypothetical protein
MFNEEELLNLQYPQNIVDAIKLITITFLEYVGSRNDKTKAYKMLVDNPEERQLATEYSCKQNESYRTGYKNVNWQALTTVKKRVFPNKTNFSNS